MIKMICADKNAVRRVGSRMALLSFASNIRLHAHVFPYKEEHEITDWGGPG